MTANLKQSSFLILGFVVVGNRKENKTKKTTEKQQQKKDRIPFHMMNLLKFTVAFVLRYCKGKTSAWRPGGGRRKAATRNETEPDDRLDPPVATATLSLDTEIKIKASLKSFPTVSFRFWLFECMCMHALGEAGWVGCVFFGRGGIEGLRGPLKNNYLSVHHLQNLFQA